MILKYVRVDMLICPGIWVIEAAAYLYTLIGFWTYLVLNVNNAFKSNSIISFDILFYKCKNVKQYKLLSLNFQREKYCVLVTYVGYDFSHTLINQDLECRHL